MKKRLRKKKHRGEFTEWGCQLIIRRNRTDGFDEFLDAFIEEAIEGNGCYCGGGGSEDKLNFIVVLGRAGDDPETRLCKVTAWVQSRPDVHEYRTGQIVDLWYGDVKDTDEEIEPTVPPEH